MGHNKNNNAMFVRASEHQAGSSGASSGAAGSLAAEAAAAHAKSQTLPFNCCAISLQPWEHPVCARGEKEEEQGREEVATIFDLSNVLPFLKKYGGINPATGGKLSASDLIPLNFTERENASNGGNAEPSKSGSGGLSTTASHEVEYVDPVSFKVFNEHTHIVAIKTTGNVYAWETVDRLNIKAKHLRDLITDTPFTRADIIHLQDPVGNQTRSRREVGALHHVKMGMVLSEKDRGVQRVQEVNLGARGSSAAKLLETIRAKTQASKEGGGGGSSTSSGLVGPSSASVAEPSSAAAAESSTSSSSKQAYNVSTVSTNRVAASFTSSGLTPTTQTERRMFDEEEYMFDQVAKGVGFGAEGQKGKGGVKAYVRLTTNFGPLNLELHVDKAPKTCYNFLTHVRDGYYNDTIFLLIFSDDDEVLNTSSSPPLPDSAL
ncbi:hypothetical protein CF326_g5106, partial [Tilletia indica]